MLALCDFPPQDAVVLRPQIVWEEQQRVQSSAAYELELQAKLAVLSLGKPTFATAVRERRDHVAIPFLNLEGKEEALFSEPVFAVTGSFVAKLTPASLPDLELGF